MKTYLMYRSNDFDLKQDLPSNEKELVQDLELNTLFQAMSQGDSFINEVVSSTVLQSITEVETLQYRQDILKDCLNNPTIIREMYDIAVETLEHKKKKYYSVFNYYPSSILYNAREVLQMLVLMLKRLRKISDEHSNYFESEGFNVLFSMLDKELDDEYFSIVESHLKHLKFEHGVLVSAELGKGNEGKNYKLRKVEVTKQNWLRRIVSKKSQSYTFYISGRDESGSRALTDLRNRGISNVASALSQSAEHIINFFITLRTELAFYVGCLNLHDQLAEMGCCITFPKLIASNEQVHSFEDLYDISLVLTVKDKIIGNKMNTHLKDLFVITGANQGGKSTFLRSIGLAQLMMQSGMYVPAQDFSVSICYGIFTHFRREEDVSMVSGKLDEELNRMNHIVNAITPKSLVLFNESFAATNEREGSEIARQIVCALIEKDIKVFFVTHLYEFAHYFEKQQIESVKFLRAERQSGGGRTFKIIDGKPLETSYGEDLYNKIFKQLDVICDK